MTRPTPSELTDALVNAFVVLSPAEQELAASAYRLLASGHPVRVDDLAGAAGWPVGQAVWLRDAPGVHLDHEGRLIGFWGLAVEAVSAHRVDVAGHATWAWCALDPLFIAPVIGAELTVESVCPVTGAPVSLAVTPSGVRDLTPTNAVVSLVVPDSSFDADVRDRVCHFVHYFASLVAGEAWASEHPPTFTLAVADSFAIARQLAERVFPAALGSAGRHTMVDAKPAVHAARRRRPLHIEPTRTR